MGSRMMHLAIGTVIQRRYRLSDDFLLGSIAPDVQKNMNVPKDASHFIDRDASGRGSLNLNRFEETYRSVWDKPFVQGYFCHLIADDIWVRGEFNQSLRHFNGSQNERDHLIEAHYQDFHSLNAILAQDYQLGVPTFSFPVRTPIVEIDDHYLPGLISDLEGDFNDIALPLVVHSDEQIKAYVEASIAEYEHRGHLGR